METIHTGTQPFNIVLQSSILDFTNKYHGKFGRWELYSSYTQKPKDDTPTSLVLGEEYIFTVIAYYITDNEKEEKWRYNESIILPTTPGLSVDELIQLYLIDVHYQNIKIEINNFFDDKLSLI